jgi:hypothetical protein
MDTYFNIAEFTQTNQFLPEQLDLTVTIKSFDLQAIRQRYINSVKTGKGTVGSVEKRPSHIGGLAQLTIKNGKITEEKILLKCKEPRGVDLRENTFAFSSENTVFVIENDKIYKITNPWFSYIHTVKLSPFNKNLLLLSSSGLDTVFEINFKTGEVVREWCAWENGFNLSYYKKEGDLYLTKNQEKAKEYQEKGVNYLYIKNPSEDFLPTAKRAAFINSVAYNPTNENKIVATFFHEGTVREIDMNTGKTSVLLDKMNSPHGGMFINESTVLATNTRGGEVVIKNNTIKNIYDFKQLKGKPSELNDKEWIQNSAVYNNMVISIDSNRNAFIVFDFEKKCFTKIPYNDNWAIQDIVINNTELAFKQDFSKIKL